MLPDSSSRISVSVGCGVRSSSVVGGHHQAGRAEAALHGAGLDERPLHVGRRTGLGEALDRRDGEADRARRQHEARAHQLAVDEDAARPALALLARALGAVEPEPLAQHVQQALAEPGVGDRVGGAVDVEDVLLAHRASREGPSQQAAGEDLDGAAAVGGAGPVVVDRAGGRRREGGEADERRRRRSSSPPSRPPPRASTSASGARTIVGADRPEGDAHRAARRVDGQAGPGDGDDHGVAHADLGVALPAVEQRHGHRDDQLAREAGACA